jgi:hypothetical protein
MQVLFDHGTPRGLAKLLAGHEVRTAKEEGWEQLTNGELLTVAERAGFEVLVTPDKNIRYQQNLEGRRIAIVVLANAQWPVLRQHSKVVLSAINAATPGSYTEVEIPG